MKSKASINGHPIHPILVSFPIAFFTATLIFDILGIVNNDSGFRLTGTYMNIAGIIGGLLAAIPGLIDYFYTVPPVSSAKTRAAQHGIINGTIIVLFVISLIMKGMASNTNLILLPDIAGFILLCISSYMGATLVYRNQIGVYNRYADKGIWKEAKGTTHNGKIEVAMTDELKVNQLKLIHTRHKRIIIGKTEKGYVAFDDRCTHKGGSLAGGVMICGTVQCPWHGSQFNCMTGEVTAGPATRKIKTYQVKEEADKVYLIL